MLTATGAGGWCSFSISLRDRESVEFDWVQVRFVLKEDGRLEPAEMYIEGVPRLTGEMLRSVPLGSIEAFGNGIGRDELLQRIAEDGPRVERATERWRRTVEPLVEVNPDLLAALTRARRAALRLRVRPNALKHPDSFYERVAELYSLLAANGVRGPAKEIADANDVPVSKVHRWIKEARARGLLAAGRRGKAG